MNMGIFSIFKKKSMFVKASLENNQLVEFFNQTEFKIGSSLEVNKNQFAVVTYMAEPLDVFTAGTYAIVLEGMPKTHQKLRAYLSINPKKPTKVLMIQIYFVSANEIVFENLVTGNVKLNFLDKEKIATKLNFSIKFRVTAPEILLRFLFKKKEIIKSKYATKIVTKFIKNNVTKLLKHKKFEAADADVGFNILVKNILTNLSSALKIYGIEVTGLKFSNFASNIKVMARIDNLIESNKSLDVEFKNFTTQETDEVVLEKVGTKSFLDKELPVEVINNNSHKSDIAVLNLNTGDDASPEVVFNKNDEPKQSLSNSYLNKLDGMLFKQKIDNSGYLHPENSPEAINDIVNNEYNNIATQYNNEYKSVSPQYNSTITDSNRKDIFCRKCGNKIDESDMFCGNCGNRLK